MILFALLCLGGAIGYVVAKWKGIPSLAAAAKIAASTSFLLLALVNGALTAGYGRSVFVALALSWLGDVLLLSHRSTPFLAGIGAFLGAHVAFSAAFALSRISFFSLAIGIVVTGVFTALLLNWLWEHLRGPYKIAVPLYTSAIMAMVSLAFAASLPTVVPIAAVAFALSDVSVANDRFVQDSVFNKAWGLPLYYVAQVLFAMSVSGVG